MRGGFVSKAFLVIASVTAIWPLLPGSYPHRDGEWQPAGLGVASEISQRSGFFELTLSIFGSEPAEAQGNRREEGAPVEAPAGKIVPRFSRITIEPGRVARFSGRGPAGEQVFLKLNGSHLGAAYVGVDGRWSIDVPALGAGDHRVALSVAETRGGAAPVVPSDEVRIAIPDGAQPSEIIAFEDPDLAQLDDLADGESGTVAEVRDRAERLAREASREFDAFSRRQDEDEQPSSERADSTGVAKEGGTDRNDGGTVSEGEDPIVIVTDWFSQSAQDYYDYVVPELAKKGSRKSETVMKDVPPPQRPDEIETRDTQQTTLPDFNTVVETTQDWLRDANRTYHDVIVRDLSRGSDRRLASEQPTETDAINWPQRRREDEGGRRAGPIETARRGPVEEDNLQQRQPAQSDLVERQAEELRKRLEAEQLENQRLAERRAAEQEEARKEAAERKRKLDELLARRAEEAREAEERARAERARQEQARLEAERERAEMERLALEAREREAERERQEALLQAERDRQVRAEAERLAREEAERARITAEQFRRQEAERQLGVRRRNAAERERMHARIAAKSERATRVGELADLAGFGKSRTAEQILEAERDATSRREIGGAQRQRRIVEVPLPADPAIRRDELRYSSRLGGPERMRRGSLKDTHLSENDTSTLTQTAGWAARAASFGGTGCKDRRAGRTIRPPGTYVVARGDTLWHISRRHYGRPLLYRRIYKANRRKIRNPHWIYPCQRFWLPRR